MFQPLERSPHSRLLTPFPSLSLQHSFMHSPEVGPPFLLNVGMILSHISLLQPSVLGVYFPSVLKTYAVKGTIHFNGYNWPRQHNVWLRDVRRESESREQGIFTPPRPDGYLVSTQPPKIISLGVKRPKCESVT